MAVVAAETYQVSQLQLSRPPRLTVRSFFQKYFLAGQHTVHDIVEEERDEEEEDALGHFIQRHRKPLSLLIPFLFVHTFYWLLAIRNGYYSLFLDHYEMSIVVVFSGLVGGATAEGGGAIAFPVMTLLLHVPAGVARDFSAMVQCIGLTSAAFSIFFMGVLIEQRTLLLATLGGSFGTIFCLEFIDPLLTPNLKKMIFVSVFFSFAIALYILNSEKKRVTFRRIRNFGLSDALILVFVGFVGGLFSGMAGTGLEVFAFSVITLLYRISEKVATPTTVSLAAINSLVLVFWRHFMQQNLETLSWKYLAVSAPVVSVFAPLGALLSSHFHRQTLAFMIYFLETITVITAYIVIRPDLLLVSISLSILGFALLLYLSIAKLGKRRLAASQKHPSPPRDIF